MAEDNGEASIGRFGESDMVESPSRTEKEAENAGEQ